LFTHPLPTISYEFVARAFALYEELAKAEEQVQAITLIIATIQNAVSIERLPLNTFFTLFFLL
jgi:hypothetical protein